jgi:MFS transporter, OFA family, oxalate/formate antiporter
LEPAHAGRRKTVMLVIDSSPPSRGEAGATRFVVLAAAILMQLCLGATYAWSVFVQPLRADTGLGQGPVQLPFTVFYVAFPATLVVAGALLDRLGPRGCTVLGGIVFGGGWMLAGLGQIHFAFTTLGVGLLGGIGVGLAYLVPITTGMLWFPRQKGLVTGVAVAGFGGGAALVAYAGNHLMAVRQLSPFEAFRLLGACFAFVIVLAGCFIRKPAGQLALAPRSEESGGVLRDRVFWLLYVAMFAGLVAGFTVNANLKQLNAASAAASGSAAVSLFALANAVGRVCWGALADRTSALLAIRLNLVGQALLLGLAPWLLGTSLGLAALATVAGLNYGGVLVLYATAVARRWGVQRVGRVYGQLFSANMPAAFAPLLAGYAYDAARGFGAVLWAIAALLVVAAALVRTES